MAHPLITVLTEDAFETVTQGLRVRKGAAIRVTGSNDAYSLTTVSEHDLGVHGYEPLNSSVFNEKPQGRYAGVINISAAAKIERALILHSGLRYVSNGVQSTGLFGEVQVIEVGIIKRYTLAGGFSGDNAYYPISVMSGDSAFYILSVAESGDSVRITRSVDGFTWSLVSINSLPSTIGQAIMQAKRVVGAISLASENTIFIGLPDSGQLFYTPDLGENWNTHEIGRFNNLHWYLKNVNEWSWMCCAVRIGNSGCYGTQLMNDSGEIQPILWKKTNTNWNWDQNRFDAGYLKDAKNTIPEAEPVGDDGSPGFRMFICESNIEDMLTEHSVSGNSIVILRVKLRRNPDDPNGKPLAIPDMNSTPPEYSVFANDGGTASFTHIVGTNRWVFNFSTPSERVRQAFLTNMQQGSASINYDWDSEYGGSNICSHRNYFQLDKAIVMTSPLLFGDSQEGRRASIFVNDDNYIEYQSGVSLTKSEGTDTQTSFRLYRVWAIEDSSKEYGLRFEPDNSSEFDLSGVLNNTAITQEDRYALKERSFIRISGNEWRFTAEHNSGRVDTKFFTYPTDDLKTTFEITAIGIYGNGALATLSWGNAYQPLTAGLLFDRIAQNTQSGLYPVDDGKGYWLTFDEFMFYVGEGQIKISNRLNYDESQQDPANMVITQDDLSLVGTNRPYKEKLYFIYNAMSVVFDNGDEDVRFHIFRVMVNGVILEQPDIDYNQHTNMTITESDTVEYYLRKNYAM